MSRTYGEDKDVYAGMLLADSLEERVFFLRLTENLETLRLTRPQKPRGAIHRQVVDLDEP